MSAPKQPHSSKPRPEYLDSPREVLPLVLEGCRPASALDVGCNCGAWLRVLLDSGVHDALGIDVLPYSEDWFIPHTNFQQHDLCQPFDLGRRFDLIVCVEVPEHVEPESADQLVSSICKHGDTVLWSAALPGQGGEGHVNEQWTEYWCEKFTAHGFQFTDPIRRQFWSNAKVYTWYRQNMVMFATPNAIARSEFLRSGGASNMFSVIHPEGAVWRNMQHRAASHELPRPSSLSSLSPRHEGKMIVPLESLYEWQLNPHQGGPAFKPVALPDDAREYLTPNNPKKLLDLKRRYTKCDRNVTIPGQWTDGYVRSEDIAYFRGDNAYLWQVRDPNCNIMGYTLSAYYVKSTDKHHLLDRLAEDEAFGNFTFEIAGRTISRDLLDSIMEIDFLDRHFELMTRRDITVLDMGSGYGRLAQRMSATVPGLTEYLCADAVPESTFISDFYLRYRNVDHKTKVIALDQLEQILTTNKIDIALNIHCFSECRLEAIEWWVSRLARAKINHLLIVPDDYSHHSPSDGLRLRSFEGSDFLPILSCYGYKLLVHEHKYSDPIVRKYSISPKNYLLFGLD